MTALPFAPVSAETLWLTTFTVASPTAAPPPVTVTIAVMLVAGGRVAVGVRHIAPFKVWQADAANAGKCAMDIAPEVTAAGACAIANGFSVGIVRKMLRLIAGELGVVWADVWPSTKPVISSARKLGRSLSME